MVKSVTAILVGAAMRDGALNIDDPVVRHLPQLLGSGYQRVTVLATDDHVVRRGLV